MPETPAAPVAPEDPRHAKMAQLGHWIGIGLVVLGSAQTCLQQLAPQLPGAAWIGPVVAALGVLMTVGHSLAAASGAGKE